MINYIEGDLFAAIKDKTCPILLPHVCNDCRAFGAGFALAISKRFPQVKADYLQMDQILGNVGYVQIGNIIVCNMIAQTLGGKRPIYYNHLATCMDKVAKFIDQDVEIHGPAFGSNLAGGKYEVIAPLIEDCWIRPFENPPKINIYYLPGTFLPPGV